VTAAELHRTHVLCDVTAGGLHTVPALDDAATGPGTGAASRASTGPTPTAVLWLPFRDNLAASSRRFSAYRSATTRAAATMPAAADPAVCEPVSDGKSPGEGSPYYRPEGACTGLCGASMPGGRPPTGLKTGALSSKGSTDREGRPPSWTSMSPSRGAVPVHYADSRELFIRAPDRPFL